MLIREASVDDLDGIRTLYAQLNPDDLAITDGRDVEILAMISASMWFHLFVGIAQERIVATCYLNVIPNLSRNGSPYGIIENVVVDQNLRNQGYGKEMMEYALAQAWQAGCYKVMLQTGSRRESTHHFYRTCGFSDSDKFAFVARPTKL